MGIKLGVPQSPTHNRFSQRTRVERQLMETSLSVLPLH